MRNIATETLPSSDKEYSQQKKISCLTDDKDIRSIFKESRAVQTSSEVFDYGFIVL